MTQGLFNRRSAPRTTAGDQTNNANHDVRHPSGAATASAPSSSLASTACHTSSSTSTPMPTAWRSSSRPTTASTSSRPSSSTTAPSLVEPSNAELAAKLGLQTTPMPAVLRPDRHRQRPGRADRRPLRRPRGIEHAGDRARPASAGRPASPSGSTTSPASRKASAALSSPTACGGRPSGSGSRCCRRRRSTAVERRRRLPLRAHRRRSRVPRLGGAARARLDLPPPRHPRRGRLHRRRRPLLRHLRRRVLPRPGGAGHRRRQLSWRRGHLPDPFRHRASRSQPRPSELSASKVVVEKVEENPKIELLTNVQPVEFRGDGQPGNGRAQEQGERRNAPSSTRTGCLSSSD